jgi:hypothetical protein
MIRIFLNNILCTDAPKNVDSLNEDLALNDQSNGYVYQITGSILFIGSDYDYLRGLYDGGYCTDVDIDIQYSVDGGFWESKSKGIIKLVSLKWDLVKKQVEAPITDNSFLSKINNNKSIKFKLGNDFHGEVLSKNGVDCSSKFIINEGVQLFSPMTGRYFYQESTYVKTNPPWADGEGDTVNLIPQPRKGMLIYDALNLSIALMTDNEVDFASTFFSYSYTAPETYNNEAWGIVMSGKQIRMGSTFPEISFGDLFNDLHKLFNVYFSLETNSAGKPTIRIENEAYFRQANSNTYFNDVTTMVESINMDMIYAKIILGCSKKEITFPIGEVSLVEHNQEEFPLTGICNTDNALDLRLTTLVINTNSISKVLPPISGFNYGNLIFQKYTNEECDPGTGGFHQKVVDSDADFQIKLVGDGYLVNNPLTDRWSYVEGVLTNADILLYDVLLEVDNTGLTKPYSMYAPSNDDSYDDDVFLIQVDRDIAASNEIFAKITNITLPGLYLYNELYANYVTITNRLGGIAQSIVDSLSDGNDEFNSLLTTNTIFDDTTLNVRMFETSQDAYRRLLFDDDSTGPTYFDTNGNFNDATGQYTVPQAGYYSANCSIKISNSTADDFIQQVELVRISSNGGNGDSATELTTIVNTTTHTFTLSKVFYCEIGDTIEVWIKQRFGLAGIYLNQYIPWSVSSASYGAVGNFCTFGVDAVYNGGGLVPASTPNEVRLNNFEADLHITRDEMDSIIANPFKYYHTNYGIGSYITGYIGKVSRNILSGISTMQIFKRKNGV